MMRNEVLHGYILHTRPYREKSRLVQFYSLEYGRIDGVTRKIPPPLYQSCVAIVSGKSSLKQFTQLEQVGSTQTFVGQSLIAGFYLNELLVKLLPIGGDTSPLLFAAYSEAVSQLSVLKASSTQMQLETILRRFEQQLLLALGYAIRFDEDALYLPIDASAHYLYQLGEGFVRNRQGKGYSGAIILSMMDAQSAFQDATLPMLSRVFRMVIASLLNYKPLKSRELWVSTTDLV